MKKHDRNGQKNNHEVKKPVSDSEAKALESVAEAAEAAEAAGEAAEETAAKTVETAKEAAETVDLDIDAAAEDVDVDVASLVNSVAQENVKASEVKAADGLPAELASALAEPRPEIKVEEAESEEAPVEETVAEEAPVEEPAVEETAASETEEAVTETAAEEPEAKDTIAETEADEAAAEPSEETAVEAETSEEPAEAAEAADGKEKNEQAEEVVLLAKNKEDKTADEASEKDTSDEGAAETASEKTESEDAAEKAESEEAADPEEAETGDEKKHEEENAKEKSALYMFLDTVKFVAIGLLIGILLVVFVIQRNDVYGSSMEPTLHTGDAVFVEMISVYTGNFDRGDIVTIDAKGMDGYTHEENLIKRIIGLPGETIKIDEGNVYINGVLLDESAYLPAGTKTFVGAEGQARGYQEITLGPDEYYCMGDNRGGSNDSRRMGPFKKSQIDAKVLARIYPFNKMRFF